MQRRSRVLIGLGASLGLVVGACSSDSKSTATTTPTTVVATTAPSTASTAATTEGSTESSAAAATTDDATQSSASPDSSTASSGAPASSAVETSNPAANDKSPILIAGLIDATGPSAGDQGNTVPVAKAWAEYINDKGGINGHPVTFEFADSGGDAAKGQSQLAEMVSKKPIAILLLNSVEASLADALKATGIPIIGVGYSPAVWGGYIEAFKLACSTDPGAPLSCALPNAFTVSTTFGAVVDEQVIGAKAAGATKLATAACAELEACSQAAPVFAADAAALGLTDTGVVKISSTAADYTSECIKFVQDGIDFIQIGAAAAAGVKMYEDCTDQGYTGIFGASAGSVSGDLIKVDGITLAGGLNGFPWWVDDAPVKEYRDTMTAAGVTADQYSSPTMTAVWSVLQLFAKANANLPDEPTKDDALAGMYTIKDETLDGLIPPITFTEGQLAADRPCFWPYFLKDGEFTNPNGGLKYSCYPPES